MVRRLRLQPSEQPRDAEAGFALVEVIVSAAVLALVAVAVLGGIDGAQSSSGREKARAVAATLAEQDQERLHSMQIGSLDNYTETRTVNVDGATYTITSTSVWTRDDQGATPSCQVSNNQPESDYLHVTSTVTSKIVGKTTAPVKVDSLVAPTVRYSSTHGTLAVKVANHAGAGLVGITVAASGPSTLTPQATNQDGCVVFQKVLVGNYTIQLNTPGYVDHSGQQLSTTGQAVNPSAITVKRMDYDVASTATVSVKTYKPGETNSSSVIDSSADKVSAINSGDSSLFHTVTPPTPPASGVTAGNLFPFEENYSFFTGGCDYDNPTLAAAANSNYFATYSGAVKVNVPPATNPVTVRQPPLNFQITRSSSGSITSSTPALLVTVRPVLPEPSETCADAAYGLTTVTYNGSTGRRWVSRANPAAPANIDSGLPFGNYTLCFRDTAPNPDKYVAYPGTYDNTAPLGRSTTTTFSPSSSSWTTTAC